MIERIQQILSELVVGQAYGMGSSGQTGQGGSMGMMEMVLPFGLMIVIMYFLVIRPQKRQADDHKNFLNKLAKGDEVITGGGICGKVSGVADNIVTVEIASNVKIKVLRSHIHPYKTVGGSTGSKVAELPQTNNTSANGSV